MTNTPNTRPALADQVHFDQMLHEFRKACEAVGEGIHRLDITYSDFTELLNEQRAAEVRVQLAALAL